MNSNKPERKEAVLPRLLELPWWAYVLIGLIALVATLILHYLNATKFPLVGTAAAIVVYLGTTWTLIAAITRYFEDPDTSSIRGELIGSLILVVVGAIAGGLGGAVWWLAVGPDVASLSQAVAGGALMGGLAVLFLLGGW